MLGYRRVMLLTQDTIVLLMIRVDRVLVCCSMRIEMTILVVTSTVKCTVVRILI